VACPIGDLGDAVGLDPHDATTAPAEQSDLAIRPRSRRVVRL
jgi:hypothetical protein